MLCRWYQRSRWDQLNQGQLSPQQGNHTFIFISHSGLFTEGLVHMLHFLVHVLRQVGLGCQHRCTSGILTNKYLLVRIPLVHRCWQPSPTCLKTWTKKCNMCTSPSVNKPEWLMKIKVWLPCWGESCPWFNWSHLLLWYHLQSINLWPLNYPSQCPNSEATAAS